MDNPYTVLDVPQSANSSEIVQAMAKAMRLRKYTTREIAEARAICSKPSSRLAADFTFPIFPEQKPVATITTDMKVSDLTVEQLDPDKYNSL